MRIEGKIVKGNSNASIRIGNYKSQFVAATKMPNLHVGTLNVEARDIKLRENVAIWPDFMMEGKNLDKSHEDYLFEACTIYIRDEVYEGFRIRPYDRPTGGGGNGDHCLEIITETILDVSAETEVTLEFRDRVIKP